MNRRQRQERDRLTAELAELVATVDLYDVTEAQAARFREIRRELRRLLDGPDPRAVRRAEPDARETERSAWRRIAALRWGLGAGRRMWEPERSAAETEADTSDQVRRSYNPWQHNSWNRPIG